MKKMATRKINMARQKANGVVVTLAFPHAHRAANMNTPYKMRVSKEDFAKKFVPYRQWDPRYKGRYLCLDINWEDDPEWVGLLEIGWDADHGGFVTIDDCEVTIKTPQTYHKLDYDSYIENKCDKNGVYEYPWAVYHLGPTTRRTFVVKYCPFEND